MKRNAQVLPTAARREARGAECTAVVAGSLRRRLRCAVAMCAGLLVGGLVPASTHAADADFPNKPLRIIVSAAAGGNLDITVRALLPRMSAVLGQPIVAENRAGGNSLPATRFVKTSPPDGYTILGMSNTFVISPNFILDTGYDPVKDFVGIGLMNWVPLLMVTRSGAPDKTLRDFVIRARQNPGKLSYASAGIGTATHLPAEMFTQQAGLKMLNVPYKGNAPAIADVLSGQVDVIFDPISTSGPLTREGRFRALAITTDKRSPLFPDVPTLAESGFPGYEFAVYTGLIAPAGTPPAIVAKWHAALLKATSSPDLRETFLKTGTELRTADTPEHFTEFLRRDVTRYAKLVQDAGIKPDKQ